MALSHDFTAVAAYQAYVQKFGYDILKRALLEFDTAKVVKLIPGVKGKYTQPFSRRDGSVIRGYDGAFQGYPSQEYGNVTLETDIFKSEVEIKPLDMVENWMGEMLRQGTNPKDFPIQKFFMDAHAESMAEDMEIAIWQGVKDAGAAANAPIIEKMDGYIKRFQTALGAGNTAIETGELTTDTIIEQLKYMYTFLAPALKKRKSKVYAYLSINHEIDYMEKRHQSLKFITDQPDLKFNLANVELIFLAGIPDHKVVMTEMANLWYGFDDINDMNRWFWKEEHYTIEGSTTLKAGTQVYDTADGYLLLNDQMAI